MHTPLLDHHVSSPRNRLLRFRVRALAVDDVKRRWRRHDRELAAEDDHVVCRGRAVLQAGSPLSPVSLSFLFSLL